MLLLPSATLIVNVAVCGLCGEFVAFNHKFVALNHKFVAFKKKKTL
jgi:hypothetical protein